MSIRYEPLTTNPPHPYHQPDMWVNAGDELLFELIMRDTCHRRGVDFSLMDMVLEDHHATSLDELYEEVPDDYPARDDGSLPTLVLLSSVVKLANEDIDEVVARLAEARGTLPDLVFRDVMTHVGIDLDDFTSGEATFSYVHLTFPDRYVVTVLDATNSPDVETIYVVEHTVETGSITTITKTVR